ncbi:MAG: glycosyltransferase [Bacteroidota bacterium]
MKKPFILILSTSGGAGHIRAADALLEAARCSGLPLRAENHNCLDFTSKAFKWLYSQSYLSMVNYIPEFWGHMYAQSERKPYEKKGLLALFDHFNYQHYIQSLIKLNPDAILCTHFLPFISISERARRSQITAPFFAATTDFDIHQLWVDAIVDHYYVFQEESAWQLAAKGIPRERISVKGIPVGQEFTTTTKHRLARQRLEIPTNRFTVLLLSGGFGVGHVEKITQSVSQVLGSYARQTFNLLVVCGRNESLRSELEQTGFPPNIHASAFGFVNNIHELMDAADILISKSGGLTSAEAMAKHLPMIIVDPIPGQELRNASMIVERGAGLFALDYHNLQFKLKKVIEDPSLLHNLRESAKALSKPHAAVEIIHDVYSRIAGQNRSTLSTQRVL